MTASQIDLSNRLSTHLSTQAPTQGSRRPSGTAAIGLGLGLGLATLAGCAGLSDPTGLLGASSSQTPAPAPVPTGTLTVRGAESGPASPTAVVESSYTLDGAILPVARGQVRSETRTDRQRNEAAVTFDNWLIRKVAGDGRSADIVRLDRELVWNLDLAKSQYTECGLTGCGSGRPGEAQKPENAGNKPAEPSCPVTVKANDVKVDATGERRTVNGFPTERFLVNWTVDLEDGRGGRNSNIVRMDLWTTPESGPIREVQAIEEQYARRHAAALSSGDGPLGRYLPKNVSGAMSLLTNRVDPKDKRTVERWAAELRKVRGYPIVTTLSWNTQGQVCGDAGGGQSAPSAQSAAAGLGAMLGGMLGGKSAGGSAGGAAAPLISFSSEVKTLAVRPVADSVFMPPPDFKRSN